MPKLKIFISYRRDDSAPYAGRVSDQLKRHFRVFIDVDSLEAGDHFRDAIEQYVTSCDVLIAVIGPRWMDADDTGKRRLDEENDLVRLEIATALRRGIRVVPGLVGAAKMPSAELLPPDLEGLVDRQAVELSERHFRDDMQHLIEVLRAHAPAGGTDSSGDTLWTTSTHVLARISQRTRAISWWVKSPVLAVVAVAMFAFLLPAAARYTAAYSLALVQATLDGGTRIPLSNSVITQTKDMVGRFARMGAPERSLSDSETASTPWSVAQVHLSLFGLDSSLKPQQIVAYLRRNIDSGCSCWRESPPTKNATPKRTVWISGYVLVLFSELGVPATDGETAFLLAKQRSDGSWPGFLVDPQLLAFSSTYATAWSILGLQSQLRRWPNRADHEAIASSVQRGVSWLLAKRGGQPARWFNYPFHSQRQTSLSISGLVLHTLHDASRAPLATLDKEWLDHLPEVIPADMGEKQYLDTPTIEGLANDYYVQIVLPWVLAATADAYGNGSPFQRARALVFLKRALTQKSVQAADTLDSWWRAELLIGMRHALSKM